MDVVSHKGYFNNLSYLGHMCLMWLHRILRILYIGTSFRTKQILMIIFVFAIVGWLKLISQMYVDDSKLIRFKDDNVRTQEIRPASRINNVSIENTLLLENPNLTNIADLTLYNLPCNQILNNRERRVKKWKNDRAKERKLRAKYNSTVVTNTTDAELAPTVLEHTCWLVQICRQEEISRRQPSEQSRQYCPCLPQGLAGYVDINVKMLTSTPWHRIVKSNPELRPGGHWTPSNCIPRRRVAVIVPYRDRERHLRAFLAHTHPVLQRQLVEYRVFVVEQNLPYLFNKATLMNIGYLESKKVFDSDCALFHDVDTLMERDDNILACGEQPVHWGGYNNLFNYTYLDAMFGSGILMAGELFEKANGFTNLFYGWGGEDDNLRQRFNRLWVQVYRGPLEVTRCTMLRHERDTLFQLDNTTLAHKNHLMGLVYYNSIWQMVEGLNVTKYDVVQTKQFPTHTWIQVNLNPPVLSRAVKVVSRWHRLAAEMGDMVFKPSPANFSVSMEQCLESGRGLTRHFLSRVTCRYLCEKDPKCVLFEYHAQHKTELDAFCVFLLSSCQRTPSKHIEIHTKLNSV